MALRQTLKRWLQRTGLHSLSVRARHKADPSRLRYRSIKRHTSTLDGITTVFSTEDEYSNRWFYPRYENGKLHERGVTESIVEAIRGATVFVDAGANLGWFTCIAARHMPEGQVFAFEMDRLNVGLLRRNVEINACENVEVFHTAVTDSIGEITYARPSDRPSATLTMAASGGDAARMETVQSTSLDAFFASRDALPDVLKIDVEGAEMGVLRGMTTVLDTAHPVLFLEVHPKTLGEFGTSAQEVLTFLTDRGYRISTIDDVRNQDSEQPLVPIVNAGQIQGNAMLYAVHESHAAA